MRIIVSVICLCFSFSLIAQENYEIQVYGSQTTAKGVTIFELHSNFTFNGRRQTVDGVLPTHNMLHETVEITHGFGDWFETGFYLFNAIGSGNRTNCVGSHIRPRVMAPESWRLPVGLSLSAEIGYQRPEYSADDWTIEIRPIIDKTWNRLYLSFNPTFEKSLHGLNQNSGFEFTPNFKASYTVRKVMALGVEYYGAVGDISVYDPYLYKQHEHQLFFVTDLYVYADWEFNAGYGIGFTESSDSNIFKLILGYRVCRKDKNKRSRM
jgi:hypothetical protein